MFRISPLPYTIHHPPPLAERIANACPHGSYQMPSAGNDRPKRQIRVTPRSLLQHRPSEERDRRRNAFLTKVRQVSDEKKWESRSDQVSSFGKCCHVTLLISDEDIKSGIFSEAETMGDGSSTVCSRRSSNSRRGVPARQFYSRGLET